MDRRAARAAATAALLVCLALTGTGRGADRAAGADLEQSCPPAAALPSVHRRSIAITGGAFGEGTMDQYPGITILRLHGTPYQMGYQHGAMLRDAIAERIAGLRGRGPAGAARALAAYYRLPASAREEIKGIARGAGASVRDLVALDSVDAMRHGQGAGAPRQAESAPDWMVVIYHPADGQKFAAITRPGSWAVLAGMREKSCCLALDPSQPGADPNRLRRSVGTGLCDQDPDKAVKTCDASVNADGGKISVRLDADAGLVCLSSDAGRSWSAVDMATETWRPECGECGEQ